jgi:predicted lactoylglutathione lyase
VEQRVSLITLGVRDLSTSRSFYTALGWGGQEVQETVFFQAGGMAVCLWGRDKLADPDGHPWEVAHNPGFTLSADGSLTLPDFGA